MTSYEKHYLLKKLKNKVMKKIDKNLKFASDNIILM
jgi:hypothetical protein